MKASTLVLTGSLLANAALVAAVVVRHGTPVDASTAHSSPTTAAVTTSPVTSTTPNTSALATTGAEAAAEAAARKTWQRFHGGDLKLMAEQLKAAGFPMSTIRSIVYAEIEDRFGDRRRALAAKMEPTSFWLQPNNSFGLTVNKELRALSAERAQLAKEALGENRVELGETMLASFRRTYGDLPYETIEKIQKLQQDYSEMQQQIYESFGDIGIMLPEDREKMSLLEKERRADIAKLLTPEQLLDYEIRTDSTSAQMRSRLGTMKPTEEEFRAIYQAQKILENEYGSLGATTPEQANARQARQKEIDAQIMASLPPDRAMLYKLATDSAYTQINRIANRFNLPSQTALDVVALQQSTQQQMVTLRTDRSLNPQQRTERLTALQQEVQAKVAATMGPRAYEAYQQYGGQWMQNMVPRARPAAPAPAPKN